MIGVRASRCVLPTRGPWLCWQGILQIFLWIWGSLRSRLYSDSHRPINSNPIPINKALTFDKGDASRIPT